MTDAHDPDEEFEARDRLLPPEDRLWRHPSEMFGPPTPEVAAVPTTVRRRLPSRAALAGACLAGAVVAVGAMWVARPTRVVSSDESAPPIRTVATTTKTAELGSGVPTAALAEDMAASVVLIRIERDGRWSNATGIWLDDRGTIAAAAAAVDGATSIIAVAADGTSAEVTVAGTDPTTGVASLIAPRTTGEAVDLSMDRPTAGEVCVVIGANGTDAGQVDGEPTVAVVVVRSTGMRAPMGSTVMHDAIEIDRAIPADAHGGILVAPSGQVIGLVAGNTSTRDLGAVSPAATVSAVATDLRDHGDVQRAWLGVRAVDLDPTRAALLGVDGGARLTEVTSASPAEAAGLQLGDVIVAVDDAPIADASDLVNALAVRDPGAETTVTVHRGDGHHDLPVTLGG